MEENMSEEGPEFEVRVETALELAGAEEGAAELERAIGKAKAVGRNFGRLAKQLARAREGVRRFRLAHPGGGAGAVETRQNASSCAEASTLAGPTVDRTEDRTAEEKGQGQHEKQGRDYELEEGTSHGSTESRPTGAEGGQEGKGTEARQNASSPAGPSTCAGASEDRTADENGQGQNENEERDYGLEEGTSHGSTEPRPAGAGGGDGGDGRMAEAGRREVEAMVRQAMEERERTRPQRENRPEEEARVAALESRLRWLEERTRIGRDF